MGRPAAVVRMTYAGYLATEAVADVRHEYLAGDVWALAGGTIEHGGLAVAVAREIGLALRGMLTKSGAKLLDFGSARVAEPAGIAGGGLSTFPTQAKPLTEAGSLLGPSGTWRPSSSRGRRRTLGRLHRPTRPEPALTAMTGWRPLGPTRPPPGSPTARRNTGAGQPCPLTACRTPRRS